MSLAKVFYIWSLITYRCGYLRSLLHPYTVQWSDFPIFTDSKPKELTNNHHHNTTESFLFHCTDRFVCSQRYPEYTTNKNCRRIWQKVYFFIFFFIIRSVHTKFTSRHYVFYYMCKTFCLHKYIYSSTILVFLSVFPPYRRILLTVLILLYFPS